MRKLRKSFITIVMCIIFIGIENVQASLLVQADNNSQIVNQTIAITDQPANQMYTAGQKVTASVTAEGKGLKYQWQYRLPNESGWTNWQGEGATTAETSYNFPESFNGISLRCVVTDAYGNSAISDTSTYTLIKKEDWELPIM